MRDLKKIFLTAGAVAAVGVTASVGTFAGFTDQQAIGNNSFSAGKVTVALAGSGTTNVLSLADMAFNDSTTGTLTVSNTGLNRASYVLTGSGIAGTAATKEFSDQLEINVLDGTTSVTGGYTSIEQFNAGSWTLAGSIAKGLNKQYTIKVRLSDAGLTEVESNKLALAAGTQTFTVKATQRAGQERTQGESSAQAPDTGANN